MTLAVIVKSVTNAGKSATGRALLGSGQGALQVRDQVVDVLDSD
jgi:hypothetical protein